MQLLPFLCGIPAAVAVSSLAGVNIAGFDFGVEITGTANLQNALAPLKVLNGPDGAGQMQHFAKDDGLNLFRLPVSWQFLINNADSVGTATGNSTGGGKTNTTTPTNSTRAAAADGALDSVNFGKYDMLVKTCLATGAKCIVDVHNYARFNGKIIGQGGPTNEQFANLWSQIATKYATETNVIFGIMNEPHDIPDLKIWAATVQAAVTAIRKAGATTQMILLPGNNFTSAQTFVSNGSAGNLSTIRNPDGSLNGLVFDVHKYLDVDNSGTHLECTSDHVTDTFEPFAKFLRMTNRTALLSETGGGNTTSCLTDLCSTLKFINANSDVYLGYAGWAAGGFSATDYNLTETPFGSNGTFTDQQIVKQCIVGMRTASAANSTASTGATPPSKDLKSKAMRGMQQGSLKYSSSESQYSHSIPNYHLITQVSDQYSCIRPDEVKAICEIFETYSHKKGGEAYWTKDTVLIYLLSQIAESSKISLLDCSNTIYQCLSYFAFYPFLQNEMPREPLQCDDLLRAIVFASGRDSHIFTLTGTSIYWESGEIRRPGRWRPWTRTMSEEMIFRSLAPPVDRAKSAMQMLTCLDDDLLDILIEVQPKFSDGVGNYSRKSLVEVANRLSLGQIPFHSIKISRDKLLRWLEFLFKMLDGIEISGLARKLESVQKEVSKTENHFLSFGEVANAAPGAFTNIQLGFIVLFNAFYGMAGLDMHHLMQHRQIQLP
ncbi:hypothetical protein G7Y89_g2393 [Cudoniella acicularis]|uniref:cellulase n=1 Tax=Cudoniella acicularis TaxID=354080 RepID=A0A8H4RU90_9HELO|nr:hypothetical protein G7Y89_g2393 [Cudoniella acicularis]